MLLAHLIKRMNFLASVFILSFFGIILHVYQIETFSFEHNLKSDFSFTNLILSDKSELIEDKKDISSVYPELPAMICLFFAYLYIELSKYIGKIQHSQVVISSQTYLLLLNHFQRPPPTQI